MAFTTPVTAVAGSTALTAAFWNEQVRDQWFMGQPVYLNEAARDAAIPLPEEGMKAYLSDPTVPAATGTTTQIPTGITTIYNGSVWVCVTPVGANTPAGGTTTSGSFTATLSGSPGTNPSVTLVTGTTALISIRGTISTGSAGQAVGVAAAVSGATTKAAALDDSGIFFRSASASQDAGISAVTIISGLTAGTNTFTLQYFSTAGSTGSFNRRVLIVQGIA